jgi:3-hydroxybutyrate dehydrogenase
MSNKKTALVSGSSSGIGEGIAKVLLQKGYRVIMHGMETEAEVAHVINNAKKYGEVLSYHNFDLSNVHAIENFVKNLNTRNITIDILVNNAGMQYVAPIQDFPKEKWDTLLAVNLSSAFHLMRLLLPNMQKNSWGRVINIASAHGLVASANKSAYVASKHGIVGLTKASALENAGNGVTCNAICPGWVLTPLVEKQIEKRAAEQGISIKQAEVDLLKEKQPSGKFVTPEQVGEYVAFLCTDSASQINGASLSIDGGWTAQ